MALAQAGMLVDKEKSKPGNIVYTPLVKELAQYKVELHPYTVRKDALPEFFTDVNQMYDALLNKSGATVYSQTSQTLALSF